MKSVAIVLMILASIYCQAVEPVTHKKYKDDVVVNLKKYSTENKRIRTDLDAQIKRKNELVVEGNAHNANLKKVTDYVNAWKSDIGKTKVDVENFEKAAKLTRHQWATVKKTQTPEVVPVKPTKKPETKDLPMAPKKVEKKEDKKTEKKELPKAPKMGLKKPEQTKDLPIPPKKKPEPEDLKELPKAPKMGLKKPEQTKDLPIPPKKKPEPESLKELPKAKTGTVAHRKLQKVEPVAQVKTLESVNAEYLSQVNELEKNIDHVIAQIRIVYAKAEKDDKDASVLQKHEQKTLEELKQFLKNLHEYIGWTRTTMASYARLFHTRPDNLFKKKTSKLMKKIRAIL